MEEDKHSGVMTIEAHDDLVQHIESTGRKMKVLSQIGAVVGSLLALSYFSQIVIVPYLLGITKQTVDLLDPSLVALELFLLALTLAWAYLSLRNYVFARRLLKQVKEIRAMEDEIEKRIAGGR